MSQFKVIFIMLFMVLSISCNGSNDEISGNNEVAKIVEGNDPYNYIATVGSQDISISGNEFEVKTDNCGASVSAKETLSRSRSFDIKLEADVSTSLGGEFKGDVLVAGAKVQTAIETSLGIQVGATETINAERELETPADSISIITLQWEEVWDTGNVNVIDDAGRLEGEIPFRVLTTLRLSQKAVNEIPCTTVSSPAVSTKATNTQTSPTETTIPLSPTPLSPTATNTPVPLPTNTPTPIPTGPRTIGGGFSDGTISLTLTDYEIDSSTIEFEFVVKNVSDSDILVRYQNSYFSLSDDTGRGYEYNVKSEYDTKQRLFTPNETVTLKRDYAISHSFNGLGYFKGVIGENAKFLLVEVSQFMGLENMQWRIDLQPQSGSNQDPPSSTILLIGEEFSDGNISLTLTDYEIGSSAIEFEFVVKNVSDSDILVRYQNSYFSLSDDTGRGYEYNVNGDEYATKQRLLEPNESVNLKRDYANSHSFNWLGYFKGVISENSEFLLVEVSQFMGLENMQWRIDL